MVLFSILYLGLSNNIYNILVSLSPDGEVKQHFVQSVKNKLLQIYLFILIVHIPIFFIGILRKIYNKISDISFNFPIGNQRIKISLLTLLIIYLIVSSLIILLRFDISTDEATYIYTVKHYFDQGKFFYKLAGDIFVIPKDMFMQNIAVLILKPFIEYSYLIPRLINFSYSLIMLLLVLYYFYKKFSIDYSIVFLLLIVSYPGFIFMSASSFGENISLLFLMLGLYYLNKNKDFKIWKYIIPGVILLSLAALTKLQLGFFLFVVLAFDFISELLRNGKYKLSLIYLISFIISTVGIFILFVFLMYDFSEIRQFLQTFYAISSGSLEPAGSIFYKFINITRLFGFQFILLTAVAVVYFIKNKNSRDYITYLIFGIIVVNVLWYVLLKGHGFRFMYYALFGITLLSVIPITEFIKLKTGIIKNIFIIFLALYLLNGIIQNVRLTIDGVSNHYLVYLNGNDPFKTYHNFVKDNSQKNFIEYLDTNLRRNEEVFLIGPESELMAYIPNKFNTINLSEFSIEKNSGKYIIKTAVNELLGINKIFDDFLLKNCYLVHREGDYYLYQIK